MLDLRDRHNGTDDASTLPASYSDELLTLAHDLGSRLLRAFDTRTGLPYSRVNLRHGVDAVVRRNDVTCTACAGTLIMEFAALSRLTGDFRFEVSAA